MTFFDTILIGIIIGFVLGQYVRIVVHKDKEN